MNDSSVLYTLMVDVEISNYFVMLSQRFALSVYSLWRALEMLVLTLGLE